METEKIPPAGDVKLKSPGPPLYYWFVLFAVIYGAFAFNYFHYGGFIEDEGVYALAARNVTHGMKPYRDFFFAQMPLLPYVYAAWFSVFGAGLESGRCLSMLFGVSSVILTSLACQRRRGPLAGIIGGLLVACNLHFVNDTMAIKTQALTTFLLSCCVFVLAARNNAHPLRQAALAMLFMTLAFLTRLSLLPAIILLWVYLGWQSRKALPAFLGLLAANVAALAAFLLFFYSDGNLLFGIYQFHHEYYRTVTWSWSRLGETIHSWLGNELPVILLFLCAAWCFTTGLSRNRKSAGVTSDQMFSGFLLLSYVGATGIHWMNDLSYATHQTPILPLAVVFAVGELSLYFSSLLQTIHRGFCIFAFVLLLLLPLPLGEIGMTLGLNFDGNRTAMGKIHEALDVIGKHASPGDSILSFDSEIAVAGNYNVPPGYEGNEFSYFPFKKTDVCNKLRLLNHQQLEADITSEKCAILCLDPVHFGMMAGGDHDLSASLKHLIDVHYLQVGMVADYGQYDQPLYIFVARRSGVTPP